MLMEKNTNTNGYEQIGVNMNVECEKEERKGVRPLLLDSYKEEIKNYVELGLPGTSIMKLINDKLKKLGVMQVSERSMRYYIDSRIKAK